MAQHPSVVVVVVTYNGMAWADRCFGSLRASSFAVRTIVVDNGSTDGTQEHIRTAFPEVELVQAEGNLGFGQGNNRGIMRALDAGAEHVFLLNQDAWVLPDTLGKLVRHMGDDGRWGVLSPMHLNGAGTGLDQRFSNYVAPAKCENLLADLATGSLKDKVYPVAFINAAAWLISRRCLLMVGGFNPVFFHYGEDDEYLKRAAYHGFGVGVVPAAIIHHDREQHSSGVHFADRAVRLRKLKLSYADPFKALAPANERAALRKDWWRALFGLKRARLLQAADRLNLMQEARLDDVVRNRAIAMQQGPAFLGR
jgi:GT2 family glycosyltransferase